MPTENQANKLLTEYLEYLEIEKNRSPLTIRNYHFYLKRFLDFAKINKLDQITYEVVRQFRLYLNRLIVNGKPLTKSTQNYHSIAIRNFLKYLARHDVKTMAPEKIELAKAGQRVVEFLDGSDLSRLLEAPLKSKNPEVVRLRDKAILELLFSTGLRVSELVNLNRDSLNLDKDEFTIIGKGNKPRVVFMSDTARYWLKEYLNKRQDASMDLFIAHDRASKGRKDEKGLTARSVERLVNKYRRQAGITKRVTPHTMRHSFATDLLSNGADIRSVQSMLGHSSITTTQIYTHVTNQQLRQIHKQFHGKKSNK